MPRGQTHPAVYPPHRCKEEGTHPHLPLGETSYRSGSSSATYSEVDALSLWAEELGVWSDEPESDAEEGEEAYGSSAL